MTESLYQQVISLLTTSPGNLVYHLVLAFSIAGALPGALNLWQRDRFNAGRRMFVGLCLLLLAQLVLIVDAGFAQFFPSFEAWLPILDRGTTAFSLVILIWLWAFPEPLRRADAGTLLLSLLILVLATLTGLWWKDRSYDTFFNGSIADMFWAGLSLVLALAGALLTVLRHPTGYGLGLGMFTLLFLGQLIYLLNPLPAGNYPGVVRLTQIAAYPLLLTLPSRYSLGIEAGERRKSGIDPLAFQQFTILATRTDPLQAYQAVTAAVSYALSADICLLISPPDANRSITLYCGYDLPGQERIGSATFDSHLVPVLSESLRQGRPLHLPAEGKSPDLAGFEKLFNRNLSGSLLAAPIFTPDGELDKAIVLISSQDKRSWTAPDQNYLADITRSLSEVFHHTQEHQTFEQELTQAEEAVRNLQVENESLRQNLVQISRREKSSTEQAKKLQSELSLALEETASLKSAQKESRLKEDAGE